MNKKTILALACVGLFPAINAGEPVGGKDPIVEIDVAPKTSFRFGVSYLNLHANEIVFGGPGTLTESNTLSHLEWDTEGAVALDLGLEHDINDRLTFFANGSIGLTEDNSHMVDYDWLSSSNPAFTDRSLHPGTQLDHFYQVDVGIDYGLIDNGNLAVDLRFGARYTDVRWTAFGGSFLYSTDADGGLFRDDSGTFPAGEAGITYRQKLPGLYAGPQFSWSASERLTISGGGIAGATIAPEDEDRHHLTQTLFNGDMDAAALFGGNIGLDYSLTDRTSLYILGNYDRYTLMTGSTTTTDTVTGARDFFGGNAQGATLETWQVKAGVKVHF